MKIFFLQFSCLLSLLLVSCNTANYREQIPFGNEWLFIKGASDQAPPQVDDSQWQRVDVPYDWSIGGPYVDASKNNSEIDHEALGVHQGNRSTGYAQGGNGWYKKIFTLPDNFKDKYVEIQFDGVYMYSDVWINGTHLGHRHYGYAAFQYDLTPYLNFGAENTLIVKTTNKMESRWFSGSGILRPVKLMVTSPVHVATWGTYITTPQISEQEAVVSVETKIENKGAGAQELILQTTLFDADNRKVAQIQSEVLSLAEGGVETVAQELNIRNPQLWSLDSPHLYSAQSELIVDGKVVDNYNTSFGVRTIEFSTTEGFKLNGEAMLLKGVCLHSDNGILGGRSYEWSEERKVLAVKEMGGNAIRCAHNMPPKSFLEACDRQGILVINEAFDEWTLPKANGYAPAFDTNWQKDVQTMLLRDRNHPCIIMWSIGNEIREQGTEEGIPLARMLHNFVKEYDTTRPTTVAVQPGSPLWSGFAKPEFLDAVDIAGYNYECESQNRGGNFVVNHQEYPNRIMYQSESRMGEFFEDWQLIISLPYVLGDFAWTGMDYLGEVGCGAENPAQKTYPTYIATCGDIDLLGFRKPRAFYRSLLWDPTPTVYTAVYRPESGNDNWFTHYRRNWGWRASLATWTWDEPEGREMTVEVYSGCEEVELLLNGKSLGRKQTNLDTKLMAHWDVPYAKGELKTIGYVNGKAVDSNTLTSAGEATKITLTLDRKQIAVGGDDVAYVKAEITDADGRRVDSDDRVIEFTIIGSGELTAVGSGSPYSSSDYPLTGDKTMTYDGVCLAIVRSGLASGDMVLSARAEGLEGAQVTVRVK